jgi:hypothetical protein
VPLVPEVSGQVARGSTARWPSADLFEVSVAARHHFERRRRPGFWSSSISTRRSSSSSSISARSAGRGRSPSAALAQPAASRPPRRALGFPGAGTARDVAVVHVRDAPCGSTAFCSMFPLCGSTSMIATSPPSPSRNEATYSEVPSGLIAKVYDASARWTSQAATASGARPPNLARVTRPTPVREPTPMARSRRARRPFIATGRESRVLGRRTRVGPQAV